MIAFRGRIGFRQYMPAKPIKYGIKAWVRADPFNGYVNEFQIYTGKEDETAEVDLTKRVVKDLTQKIKNVGMIVNTDSFYTSPALFKELLEEGIAAQCTCRINR
ncbi:hypothetical protein SNE40_005931 [Patella caerulea]|uniref:PiggyBac transposable element-derived protein domain-containing protein n=1 Tax=Patella caerulea TaxID=87958 RepID=A0AAN8PZB0_PATCE